MSAGTIAFDKLEKLAQIDELTRVMAKLNQGASNVKVDADITSCAATATAVVKTLMDIEIKDDYTASSLLGAGGKTLARGFWAKLLVPKGQSRIQTSEVLKHVDEGWLVMISLSFMKDKTGGGDHHFAVFALDAKTVVVAMGWQKKYDLSQWFAGTDGGKMPRDRFKKLLGKIEDGFSDAVVELCSFEGTIKGGDTAIDVSLAQEVTGYRADSKAQAFKLPTA